MRFFDSYDIWKVIQTTTVTLKLRGEYETENFARESAVIR